MILAAMYMFPSLHLNLKHNINWYTEAERANKKTHKTMAEKMIVQKPYFLVLISLKISYKCVIKVFFGDV